MVVDGTFLEGHVTRVRQCSDSVDGISTSESCDADSRLESCFWATFTGTKREPRDSRTLEPAPDSESNARRRRARRKTSRFVGAEGVGLSI